MQKDPTDRATSISTTPLRCLECGQVWSEAAERWRVYLTNEKPQQTLTYCAYCARREFD
jgi:DNA-directed RNA polymerase subunit N (RpoN/RPB10)